MANATQLTLHTAACSASVKNHAVCQLQATKQVCNKHTDTETTHKNTQLVAANSGADSAPPTTEPAWHDVPLALWVNYLAHRQHNHAKCNTNFLQLQYQDVLDLDDAMHASSTGTASYVNPDGACMCDCVCNKPPDCQSHTNKP